MNLVLLAFVCLTLSFIIQGTIIDQLHLKLLLSWRVMVQSSVKAVISSFKPMVTAFNMFQSFTPHFYHFDFHYCAHIENLDNTQIYPFLLATLLVMHFTSIEIVLILLLLKEGKVAQLMSLRCSGTLTTFMNVLISSQFYTMLVSYCKSSL